MGAFVYHWSPFSRLPSLFRHRYKHVVRPGSTPARALLFKNLNTPSDQVEEFGRFSQSVFRFLQSHHFCIGLLSLLLLRPPHRISGRRFVWFAGLTLAWRIAMVDPKAGGAAQPPLDENGLPIVCAREAVLRS